jgi:hypothetical protein
MCKLTLTMVSLVIAITACKQEPRLPDCNSQEILRSRRVPLQIVLPFRGKMQFKPRLSWKENFV